MVYSRSSSGEEASSRGLSASAIAQCFDACPRARVFLLFFFSSLAEGHVTTSLRRSRGLKAGKKERVTERKPGLVFSIKEKNIFCLNL